MKKLTAGDKCEVESQGSWIPATILTVYPGHSGAMVLPDNWATSVWAKNTQIRQPAVNPSNAKRGDYTHGQKVEVQRAMGRWVDGYFSMWEDGTRERAYVAIDGNEASRFHYTNIRTPRVQPDPHSIAYQGEVGDHQPRTVTVELKPDVDGFLNNLRRPKRRPLSPGGRIPAPRDLAETLIRLGEATTSIAEQVGFIEIATEFAKAGIDPEQAMKYVAELARAMVMGIQPAELHHMTTEHLRHRTGYPTAKLHHISNAYRGH